MNLSTQQSTWKVWYESKHTMEYMEGLDEFNDTIEYVEGLV